MKPIYYYGLLLLAICSCSTLRPIPKGERTVPPLGTIGKGKSSLTTPSSFRLYGKPVITEPLPIRAQQIPFTKSTFRDYANNMERLGKTPEVMYVDSLPIKPAYVKLELSDMISLRALLNGEDNGEVLSYLATDRDQKIVSSLSFVPAPELVKQIGEAEALFLVRSKNGPLALEFRKGGERTVRQFPTDTGFEYGLADFCWKTDRHGKPQIGAIVPDGGACPDDTNNSATKATAERSYLKF